MTSCFVTEETVSVAGICVYKCVTYACSISNSSCKRTYSCAWVEVDVPTNASFFYINIVDLW